MKISTLLALWFGAGKSRYMPGTAGSLAALPFAWVIQSGWGNTALFLAAGIAFFIGWWAANAYMRNAKTEHDPKEIVMDEVAGQWLLLAFMPPTLTWYAVGFLLFRAFDIVKPWPICVLDRRIHGGLGVMLDDIAAALYPPLIFAVVTLALRFSGSPIDTFQWLRWLVA